MDVRGSAGNVIHFPAGRTPAGRRTRPTVADVEDLLRERWQDVVHEPIPGRWLQLLSLFERVEAEHLLARTTPEQEQSRAGADPVRKRG